MEFSRSYLDDIEDQSRVEVGLDQKSQDQNFIFLILSSVFFVILFLRVYLFVVFYGVFIVREEFIFDEKMFLIQFFYLEIFNKVFERFF